MPFTAIKPKEVPSEPVASSVKSTPTKKSTKEEKATETVKKTRSPALKRPTHPKVEVKEEAPKSARKSGGRSKRASEDDDDDDEEYDVDEEEKKITSKKAKMTPKAAPAAVVKPSGRGAGAGTGASDPASKPAAGRGRGGGGGGGGWRGGFVERGAPPHKGEKEVPEGAEDALAGFTIVISGTLDSLEREEAEDLIKRHGGRITGSISKKTSYLLADEDVGGRKSQKAKELKVPFLTEDGLFELIRKKPAAVSPPAAVASSPASGSKGKGRRVAPEPPAPLPPKAPSKAAPPPPSAAAALVKGKAKAGAGPGAAAGGAGNGVVMTEAWPQKYAPHSVDDIVANQTLVKQLQEWMANWDAHHLHGAGKDKKGKKGAGGSSSSKTGADKKAVLISGGPGIGKTTTARLVCEQLGRPTLEVNASDTRGKADTKIGGGMGGRTANAIKEMVTNTSLAFGDNSGGEQKLKPVLIMDEVDGMSGGDRGGVADLIASIKSSSIPIVCICNDRYSRKLQSLVNHCLLLNYRKPTKQQAYMQEDPGPSNPDPSTCQMAKRLRYVANQEKLQVADTALEELAEKVNGDMRMALNQLQYMALSSRTLSYADLKARLNASAKDEDMKPMAALDKLLGMGAGRLRLDERIDAAMSDIDLIPLMLQENYLNYRPIGVDPESAEGLERMSRAADSISDGDRVNVQVRRYQQWQHLPFSTFMSCLLPGICVHGSRTVLAPGEMNFNRFPGWLGKNSTTGKNRRLLDELHSHILASRVCEPTRLGVRLDYLPLLKDSITGPLKTMSKEEGVGAVLQLLEEYSITLEDYDTILELSRLKGMPDTTKDIPAAVKSQLTREFKKRSHKVKSADLLPAFTAPGQKKGPATRRRGRAKGLEIVPGDAGMDADVPVAVEDDGAAELEEEGEEDEEDASNGDADGDAAAAARLLTTSSTVETSGGAARAAEHVVVILPESSAGQQDNAYASLAEEAHGSSTSSCCCLGPCESPARCGRACWQRSRQVFWGAVGVVSTGVSLFIALCTQLFALLVAAMGAIVWALCCCGRACATNSGRAKSAGRGRSANRAAGSGSGRAVKRDASAAEGKAGRGAGTAAKRSKK
eukprot:jgi/Mesen1/8707/ME000052S08136